MINAFAARFKQELTRNEQLALAIWLGITLFCAIQSIVTHRYNNYLIFEGVYHHLVAKTSLYAAYPTEYDDANHYGPIFGVFISIFTFLPKWLGLSIWDLFNTGILFYAIKSLNLKDNGLVYFLAIPCLASSALSEQFNPATAAFIILSYTQLNHKKGLWATFFIMLGAFIKLYGIIGLAFFFFVKDKKTFFFYLMMWATLFFALPMLFSSKNFILFTYQDWARSLAEKNVSSILGAMGDISIMGFVRNIFYKTHFTNTLFLSVGLVLFAQPYFNFKSYSLPRFQQLVLASALSFVVLFSTGSEDCTYIIAIVGVGILLAGEQKTDLAKLLSISVLVVSCNFAALFFPHYAGKHPIFYSMISLPFFIAWLWILFKSRQANLQFSATNNSFNNTATI